MVVSKGSPNELHCGKPGFYYRHKASIRASFFFSARALSGGREAKYPPNAAAARNANVSAASQGLPVKRPVQITLAEIAAITTCAPSISQTDTPELRWLRSDPKSSLRGKFKEDQFAMGS